MIEPNRRNRFLGRNDRGESFIAAEGGEVGVRRDQRIGEAQIERALEAADRRGPVAREIARTYPRFAERLFPEAVEAAY